MIVRYLTRLLCLLVLGSLIVSCGSNAKQKDKPAQVGPFSYGMTYAETIKKLAGHDGSAALKGTHQGSAWVLVSYYHFNQPYVFAFKDFRLVAIMKQSVLFAAWKNALAKDKADGVFPFENGFGNLYDEVLKRRNSIHADKFVDLRISKEIKTSEAQSSHSNIGEAASMLMLVAIASPLLPVGAASYALGSSNESKFSQNLTKIQLQDSKQKVDELLGDDYTGMINRKSDYIFRVYTTSHNKYAVGIQNGKVAWITSFGYWFGN